MTQSLYVLVAVSKFGDRDDFLFEPFTHLKKIRLFILLLLTYENSFYSGLKFLIRYRYYKSFFQACGFPFYFPNSDF